MRTTNQRDLLIRIDERVQGLVQTVKWHSKAILYLAIVLIIVNLDKAGQLMELVVKTVFANQ